MEGSAPDLVAFGQWLRAARMRAGLSLDALSGRIKLSPAMVASLEEGEASRLPERVFLVAALRAYAGAVGLGPDDVLARFDGLPEAPRVEAFNPRALEASRRARAITVAWAVAAAVAALALWGYWARFEVLVMRLGSR